MRICIAQSFNAVTVCALLCGSGCLGPQSQSCAREGLAGTHEEGHTAKPTQVSRPRHGTVRILPGLDSRLTEELRTALQEWVAQQQEACAADSCEYRVRSVDTVNLGCPRFVVSEDRVAREKRSVRMHYFEPKCSSGIPMRFESRLIGSDTVSEGANFSVQDQMVRLKLAFEAQDVGKVRSLACSNGLSVRKAFVTRDTEEEARDMYPPDAIDKKVVKALADSTYGWLDLAFAECRPRGKDLVVCNVDDGVVGSYTWSLASSVPCLVSLDEQTH
jgi:hypothetical protein